MKYKKWTDEDKVKLEELMLKHEDNHIVAKHLNCSPGAVVQAWIRYGFNEKYPDVMFSIRKQRKLPKDKPSKNLFWRQFPKQENYYISNKGDVYCVSTQKLRKQIMKNGTNVPQVKIGYCFYTLARVVYMTWKPEKFIDDDKHRIIHINGNSSDCRIQNLKQVTQNEAARLATLRNKGTGVVQIKKNGEVIVYPFVIDAMKALGVSKGTIYRYCRDEVAKPQRDLELMFLDDYNEMMKWRNEVK